MYFCYFLHFKKGLTLHLNKLEFPIRKATLCQVWLKCPVFLEKKMKVSKVYRQMDGPINGPTDQQMMDNKFSKKSLLKQFAQMSSKG